MSTQDFDDDRLVRQVRRCLEDSIADLDPAIGSRLDRMRREALAGASEIELDALQAARVRRQLDGALEPDPATVDRLDQIRHRALQRAGGNGTLWHRRPHRISRLPAWLDSYRLTIPAGVFATACLIVTVASLTYYGSNRSGVISVDEEILLVASADDIELYENLDFYLWLAENGLPN